MLKHNKPAPVLRIAASRGFSELTQNRIKSSHGHCAPSLKISCKSVKPFCRKLADKETNKETMKQRNKETRKSTENNTPSPFYYIGVSQSTLGGGEGARHFCPNVCMCEILTKCLSRSYSLIWLLLSVVIYIIN